MENAVISGKSSSDLKEKIRNAMLDLLEKKEFAEISVSELCKSAGIEESSFHENYADLDALLSEMHTLVLQKFIASIDIQKYTSPDKTKTLFSDEYTVPYLEFMKANKAVFKACFSRMENYISDAYKIMEEPVFLPAFKTLGFDDSQKTHYGSKAYLWKISEVLKTWLEGDCKESPEVVYQIFNKLYDPAKKEDSEENQKDGEREEG